MNKCGAGKPPVGLQNQFHSPDTSTSCSRTLVILEPLTLFIDPRLLPESVRSHVTVLICMFTVRPHQPPAP